MYLKQGDTGITVKNFQYTLHMLTYIVNGIDGSFGPGMEAAVRLYQTNNGLAVNGIIDNPTFNSIAADIKPIKVQLRNKGFYNSTVLQGIGSETLYNAVLAFQRANGLQVDGRVGPATRVKLFSEGSGNTVVGDDEFPLVQGDKGDNVLYLQYGLHVLACEPGPLDGSFGPAVDTSVRNFQRKYGLAVDSSVGPATWTKMKQLITEIQQALFNLNDPDIKISIINGIAGPETYNAVCSFQARHGLSVDGSVGPATRPVLFGSSSSGTQPADGLPLTYGSTGTLVRKFQYGLHICGINPNGFDGSFGPGMLTAVRSFQSKYGLSVDGSVGSATWSKMLEIIKPIQQALKTAGYFNYSVNGEPDATLYNALVSYQSDHGLSADGMFGPQTKASLGLSSSGSANTGTGTVSSVLVQGSNGSLVRYLQKILNLEGYSLTVDGSFGPAMDSAVRRFQTNNGLAADGSVGPATWAKVFANYAIPTLGSSTKGERVARAAEYELSLGFSEDNANDITPYGEWYGMNGQPWCAMFVSWCAWQAGYMNEIIPRYAYCPSGKNWFVQRGRYAARNSNYRPRRGDVVFYWDGSTISHTGIVVGSTATTMTAIEGNASRRVKQTTYSLTNTYIDGYGIFDLYDVDPDDRPENPNLPDPDNKDYRPPQKQDNSGMTNMRDMLSYIRLIEAAADEYMVDHPTENPMGKLFCVLSYLKQHKYNSVAFDLTSGWPETDFYPYADRYLGARLTEFNKFIGTDGTNETTPTLLKDDIDGVIDLPHLAATVGGYTIGILGNYIENVKDWVGWVGDLATGIAHVYNNTTSSSEYQTKADETIGSVGSPCNYSDVCTDSDAIKIAEIITNDPNHSFSAALEQYYNKWVNGRYSYLYERILGYFINAFEADLETFAKGIYDYFYGQLPVDAALITLMGESYLYPEVVKAGCISFAKYVLYYLGQ